MTDTYELMADCVEGWHPLVAQAVKVRNLTESRAGVHGSGIPVVALVHGMASNKWPTLFWMRTPFASVMVVNATWHVAHRR